MASTLRARLGSVLLAVLIPSLGPVTRAQEHTRPRRVREQGPTGSKPETAESAARAAGPAADEEVIRVNASEVLLPVTVRDDAGALVTTLKRADFRVWEDGREQPLSDLDLRRVPVDVALLIDSSSSTADNLEDFRRAATDFAALLGPDDRVCLIKFGDRVELLQDWTRSRTQLRRALARLAPGMFTRFNEALYLAAREQLRPGPGRRRALVVLTDGIDSGRGPVRADAALKAILESQAAVYVLSSTEIARRRKQAELDSLLTGDSAADGYSSLQVGDLREGLRVLGLSEESLGRLCGATGGRLYKPESFAALAALYREIADELRHQYALYYTPLNKARDGSFRRVQVAVTGPGMQATARAGYFAPR